VHPRLHEARMPQQGLQEVPVVLWADQGRMRQGSGQAAQGVCTVMAVHHQLGHQAVVVRADVVALAQAVVDAQAGLGLQGGPRLPVQHRAGLRAEAVGGVFGHQPRFDGVALPAHLVLRQWQGFTRGHPQLPLHQVQAGEQFRHRVFHLQTCVHLQEKVLPLGVDDELDRACAHVGHGLRCGHGVAAQCGAQFSADDG
jgi:hypothetical protein